VAWSETFFRVVVPDAIASPSVVPNVLPELPVPEATILSDEASAIDAPGEPTGVVEVIGFAPVPPRGIYQVDVVCLGFAPVRWSLGLEGESGFLAAGDQTCDGQPESQTLSLGVPPRDVPLFIQADAATAWHIVVSSTGTLPQLLPAALRAWPTVEPDGAAAAAEAFGHCVSSEFGADPCGQSWETAPDARRVRISSGDNVTFQLEDGWDIAQARVTAVAAGTFDPEYSVGFVDAAGSEVVIPIELDPGHWTVQMSLNARRGSESFGAWYNFPLEVTESHPAPPPSRHGPLRPAIFLRGLTSGDRRPYRASADRAHARDTLPRAPRGRRGRRYRPGRGRVKRGGNIDRLCREGPRGLPTSWRLQVGAVSSRAGRGSVEGHLTNERAVTSSSGPFQCRLRPLWLMRRPKARFPLQLRRMDHGRSNVAGRWPAGGMAEPVAT
jgi:hypothetical protein